MTVETSLITSLRARIRCTCSVSGGQDVACEIIGKRADELTVVLPPGAVARIGDKTTLFLPSVGLIEGQLVQRGIDGHVIRLLEMRPLLRARLEAYLDASDAPPLKLREKRRHERIVPLNRLVQIEQESNRRYMARIIDVSRSGVAVTCMAKMATGAEVIVGTTKGMIVRILDGGYAVAFHTSLADPFDVKMKL